MKVSALLINHNSHGTILKSIRSLLEQGIPLEKIVVVDNASTDGDPERIRQLFPNVNVIELKENKGPSAARNHGLGVLSSDMVLLVDDDIYLTKGALASMVNAHLETGAAVICPRIILYPETDVIHCDGASVHFTGTLSLSHVYHPHTDHPPQRNAVKNFIGACLLVDQRQLENLLIFDEDYFFYFEDMELSFRLSALGHKILCEENAVVHHERGEGTENLSFRGTGSYPRRRAYFTIRNRWLTILLHYQMRTLLLLSPVMALYELAALAESARRGWLPEYIRAIISLLGEVPSILKRRKHWQSQRIVNDREILTGGDLPLSRGFVETSRSRSVQLFNDLLNWYWDRVKVWL
jgi:GT2 family glycosyltransferase